MKIIDDAVLTKIPLKTIVIAAAIINFAIIIIVIAVKIIQFYTEM